MSVGSGLVVSPTAVAPAILPLCLSLLHTTHHTLLPAAFTTIDQAQTQLTLRRLRPAGKVYRGSKTLDATAALSVTPFRCLTYALELHCSPDHSLHVGSFLISH